MTGESRQINTIDIYPSAFLQFIFEKDIDKRTKILVVKNEGGLNWFGVLFWRVLEFVIELGVRRR